RSVAPLFSSRSLHDALPIWLNERFCCGPIVGAGVCPNTHPVPPSAPATQSPSPSIAQAYRFIHRSSSRTRRDLGTALLVLSDTRGSRALTPNYAPPFPAVNLASTRASPARRVTPRRSAHSSSGIKYLRVSPRRSRSAAGVAEPSSTSVASRAARNSARAPVAA